jgi:predicted P-loop ATPase
MRKSAFDPMERAEEGVPVNAAATFNMFGADPQQRDYDGFAARWIHRELADAAGLRRINGLEGRDFLGRKSGNLAGILIPNVRPGEETQRGYRVRLDEPAKGGPKYLSPPGRGNLVYFPPGVDVEILARVDMPVMITEGEFKTLALWRLATPAGVPSFLPIGLGGVWSFRGTIGKVPGPNGERLDEKGVIADFQRIAWLDRKVIIAFDADAKEKEQVRIARATLARELRSRGAKVAFLEWDIVTGKGIDDHLAAVGPDVVLAEIAAVDFEKKDWHANLIRSSRDDNPRAIFANAVTALREAPDFSGLLAYSQFSMGVTCTRPTPWGATVTEWTDHEDRLTANWLQHQGVYVSVEVAGQAAQTVAKDQTFHPVKAYLDPLEWDGIKRLEIWLGKYLGVASSDYTAAVGARWMISAVARIYNPGVKADCCLILEGAQGIKKSTSLGVLGGEFFADEIADLGSKDAAMQTRGAWIIEIAELDSMSRGEVSKIKAFMSRGTDRFRPPYGKRVIESPRQCVFAGSVNHTEYLRDATGGRRFWPVTCGEIDIDKLRRDRDQLWAEAVVRYRAGDPWWLDTAELNREAEQEQQDRFEGDPWDELIAQWLPSHESVSIGQVLEMIGKPKESWTQADKLRIGRSLRNMGWEMYKSGPRKARELRFRPSGVRVSTSQN